MTSVPIEVIEEYPHPLSQDEITEHHREVMMVDEDVSVDELCERMEQTLVEHHEWRVFISLYHDHLYFWNRMQGHGVRFENEMGWRALLNALSPVNGVRGREEIREKLEEAKGEGVGLYSDVANHIIRVTLEWVLKQQDSLEEPVLGVRDSL